MPIHWRDRQAERNTQLGDPNRRWLPLSRSCLRPFWKFFGGGEDRLTAADFTVDDATKLAALRPNPFSGLVDVREKEGSGGVRETEFKLSVPVILGDCSGHCLLWLVGASLPSIFR